MRTLLALLVLTAATPARAEEISVRAGADRDGFVAAASAFLTRARLGGLQAEAILHRAAWLEVPVLAHLDLQSEGNQAFYVVLGPSLRVDFDNGGKTRVGMTMGGGFEIGAVVLDGRYTTGKKTFTVSAGVRVVMPRRKSGEAGRMTGGESRRQTLPLAASGR